MVPADLTAAIWPQKVVKGTKLTVQYGVLPCLLRLLFFFCFSLSLSLPPSLSLSLSKIQEFKSGLKPAVPTTNKRSGAAHHTTLKPERLDRLASHERNRSCGPSLFYSSTNPHTITNIIKQHSYDQPCALCASISSAVNHFVVPGFLAGLMLCRRYSV